mgnify:CR=1 FL=1
MSDVDVGFVNHCYCFGKIEVFSWQSSYDIHLAMNYVNSPSSRNNYFVLPAQFKMT